MNILLFKLNKTRALEKAGGCSKPYSHLWPDIFGKPYHVSIRPYRCKDANIYFLSRYVLTTM